ncbi:MULTISPECIES: NAD(P)H-dependent oxidoreductase [unclassified Nocardia]|uniref:NADPH-dependent FMN reductase n=1 Tax=unclassified Nocardia TaxID=2637762 RepID=UPI0024A7D863|nr:MULTISPECIES: NAD(P)H-dependent oxidoreductase [unclassified Nocardia]
MTYSILAISGSLSVGSHNTALLRTAQRLGTDLDIEIYEGLRDIPPYDLDFDDPYRRPAVVTDLRRRITEADGLLIATPEFNHSMPGVLKNAIDWVSTDWAEVEGRPLLRKPIAIMGASPSRFGSVRAQLALRQVLLQTRSDVVVTPQVIIDNAHERFDDDGNPTDRTTVDLLANLLTALADKIDRAHRPQPVG